MIFWNFRFSFLKVDFEIFKFETKILDLGSWDKVRVWKLYKVCNFEVEIKLEFEVVYREWKELEFEIVYRERKD